MLIGSCPGLRIEESAGNALKKANKTDHLATSGGMGPVHDSPTNFANYNMTLQSPPDGGLL